MSGDFVGSLQRQSPVGYKTGTNPFVLAGFGPGITDETKAAIEEAQALATEEAHLPRPEDQDGEVVIEDGVVPTYAENDAMDFVRASSATWPSRRIVMTGTVAHTTPYAWPRRHPGPRAHRLVVVGPSGDPPEVGLRRGDRCRVDALAGSLRATGAWSSA